MKKILVLFPKDWDLLELKNPKYKGQYQFYFEGFDLFSFPSNASLLTFDIFSFIDKLVRKYTKLKIDGVFSNNEQFGALIAAEVAKRLQLPGTHPQTIISAQHKYYARKIQQQYLPEATPKFEVFTFDVKDKTDLTLPFPLFVKPVKATYSVLAREIEDFPALLAHIDFHFFEKMIIKKLIKPFDQMMFAYTNHKIGAFHMVAEEILSGIQVNVDGYMFNGQMTIMGIVQAIMFPGTNAFKRWEYPCQLPNDIQLRMKQLTEKLLQAMDYHYGFFNVELFYDENTDQLKIIEINPRLASQFIDLYEKVDGFNTYDILMSLALGEKPLLERGMGKYRRGASFVFRRFEEKALEANPRKKQLTWITQHYPDAKLMLYIKTGGALKREIKWLGSYRYAVLNLGGQTETDLFDTYTHIAKQLNFDIC